MKCKKIKIFQIVKKKRLVNLVRTLDKKVKYQYPDRDDLDYYGIKDIENLFNDDFDDNIYYKPILIDSSFKKNYRIYESKGDKNKNLSIKEYLYMIIPYLSNLINIQKTNENKTRTWKIQLDMSVNFIASNDTREIRTAYVWSDNEEIRPGNDTNDIFVSLINSFLSNYQTKEAILRNGSNFVFESADLLTYYIHKTSMKRGKSYLKSPPWLLVKKATINPKNNDHKCF